MIMRKSKLRHKLAFIFLLVLFLFGYFSITSAFDGQKIDFTDFKGVSHAVGIYFSWIGSEFDNAQAITTRAVENNSENNQLQ